MIADRCLGIGIRHNRYFQYNRQRRNAGEILSSYGVSFLHVNNTSQVWLKTLDLFNRGKEKRRDREMRIDNSYLSGLIPGEIRTNAEGSEPGQKGEIKASLPPQSTTHVPSPELVSLRQHVQLSPDVRPDAITRASQLLQSGYYNSSDAAQRTAEAMIQAID
jgi:hypothetical protein